MEVSGSRARKTAFNSVRRHAAMLVVLGCFANTAFAATLIVNSTGDGADLAPGNGVCDTGGVNSEGATECTLRAAIAESNALGGPDNISFNIPTSDPGYAAVPLSYSQLPASALPAISAQVVIDGTTQPDFPGSPIIAIYGDAAGVAANGLTIVAGGGASTIRGLAIVNFMDNGVLLQDNDNIVAGNYIGIAPDGITPAGNNRSDTTFQGGIRVETRGNTIGGLLSADRNVLSANFYAGISINGGGARDNLVLGNYIGLDAGGTIDRGNSDEGIDITTGRNNTIGGTTPGARNVISGNGSDGVDIDAGDFNIIQGNYIGTDFTGTSSIPNDRDGIDIDANSGVGGIGNLVGGTLANAGNLIRGNTLYGVQVRFAVSTGNTILGNRIYGNGLLGIDLNDDVISVNDLLDPDSGPNDILNHPTITKARDTSGIISATFDLDVPAGNYRIEFFKNPAGAHASGHGEGEAFTSALTIAHAGTGVQTFVHTFSGAWGDIITATATEEFAGPSYGSTSEFSNSSTAVVSGDLNGHWRLDETSGTTAFDSEAGNNGVYRNGVTLNQAGNCANTGSNVYFDGIDDFVEIPHAANYLLDVGTISLWANVDALGASQGLFSKDSAGFDTGGQVTIRVTPGGNVEARLESTGAANIVTSAPISANVWFHVTFQWGPAGMALFIDGVAPVTNPYTGGLGTTSGGAGNFEPIALGASTIGSGNGVATPTQDHLAGYMDDVRIYRKVLTPAQILTLATCVQTSVLTIVKRAFWLDGTPIPSGATIPSGVSFKYLLYINNANGGRSDISVRDMLMPAFQYLAGTIQVDNSVTNCAAATCTAAEEQAIFTAAIAAGFATDAIDGDTASYVSAGTTIDAGNGNTANAQLDLNGNAVWAILFSVRML